MQAVRDGSLPLNCLLSQLSFSTQHSVSSASGGLGGGGGALEKGGTSHPESLLRSALPPAQCEVPDHGVRGKFGDGIRPADLRLLRGFRV